MLRKLAVAVAMTGGLGGSVEWALALELGPVELRSSLNQPLSARIELLDQKDLLARDITAAMASRKAFRKAKVPWSAVLEGLRFETLVQQDGRAWIRVSSKELMREPFLNFLVEVKAAGKSTVREYTLLFDPASPPSDSLARSRPAAPGVSRQARVVEPARSAPVRPRPPSVPGAPGVSLSSNYRVQANDTLWELALRLRPGEDVSAIEMMDALQRNNPDAFLGGNINRLKQGALLRVPDRVALEGVNTAAAARRITAQNLQWQRTRKAYLHLDAAHRETAAAAASPGPGQDRLTIVSRAPGVAGEGAEQGSGKSAKGDMHVLEDFAASQRESLDSLHRENRELRDRMRELQEQIESLEKLVELKSRGLATAVQALSEAEQSHAEERKEAAENESSRMTEAPDDAAEETTPPFFWNSLYVALFGAAGALGLLLLGRRWRARSRDRKREELTMGLAARPPGSTQAVGAPFGQAELAEDMAGSDIRSEEDPGNMAQHAVPQPDGDWSEAGHAPGASLAAGSEQAGFDPDAESAEPYAFGSEAPVSGAVDSGGVGELGEDEQSPPAETVLDEDMVAAFDREFDQFEAGVAEQKDRPEAAQPEQEGADSADGFSDSFDPAAFERALSREGVVAGDAGAVDTVPAAEDEAAAAEEPQGMDEMLAWDQESQAPTADAPEAPAVEAEAAAAEEPQDMDEMLAWDQESQAPTADAPEAPAVEAEAAAVEEPQDMDEMLAWDQESQAPTADEAEAPAAEAEAAAVEAPQGMDEMLAWDQESQAPTADAPEAPAVEAEAAAVEEPQDMDEMLAWDQESQAPAADAPEAPAVEAEAAAVEAPQDMDEMLAWDQESQAPAADTPEAPAVEAEAAAVEPPQDMDEMLAWDQEPQAPAADEAEAPAAEAEAAAVEAPQDMDEMLAWDQEAQAPAADEAEAPAAEAEAAAVEAPQDMDEMLAWDQEPQTAVADEAEAPAVEAEAAAVEEPQDMDEMLAWDPESQAPAADTPEAPAVEAEAAAVEEPQDMDEMLAWDPESQAPAADTPEAPAVEAEAAAAEEPQDMDEMLAWDQEPQVPAADAPEAPAVEAEAAAADETQDFDAMPVRDEESDAMAADAPEAPATEAETAAAGETQDFDAMPVWDEESDAMAVDAPEAPAAETEAAAAVAAQDMDEMPARDQEAQALAADGVEEEAPTPAGETMPSDDEEPEFAAPSRLDLARVYMEMGEEGEAQSLLENVLQTGEPEEREEAARLMEKMGR